MPSWKKLPKHPNIFEYETMKGKRYGIRRAFTDQYGHHKEFSRSGFKSWREADVQLKLFETRLARGEIGLLSNNSVTLTQYYLQLRERKLKMGIWKKSTAKVSLNYFNQYFRETFDDIPLDKIKRIDYQRMIDQIGLRTGDESLSKTTINTINSIMQVVMNDAE